MGWNAGAEQNRLSRAESARNPQISFPPHLAQKALTDNNEEGTIRS